MSEGNKRVWKAFYRSKLAVFCRPGIRIYTYLGRGAAEKSLRNGLIGGGRESKMSLFYLYLSVVIIRELMIRLIFALCGLLAPGLLAAGPVSAERAQRLAAGFFGAGTPTRGAAEGVRLVWTGEGNATRGAAGDPALYVFERTEGGFVVIAGDDIARPVLGYAAEGRFATERMPANLRDWFAGLCAQIEGGRAAGVAATPAVRAAWNDISVRAIGTPVVELETARWNQYEPYNDLCPRIDGTRAVTGCVPTALAIVMRYHRWPERGVGTLPSYVNRATGSTVPGHALGHVYDWNLMPLDYDARSSAAQNAQVARLMYDLGVMSQAAYNLGERGGTAAYTHVAVIGLLEYMGYSKSATLRYRDWYDGTAWDDLIRDEIRLRGPVLYAGANGNNEGHQFVIDGYTSTDYFSVNWGWGGHYDGYFLLSALDPAGVGAGGGSGDGFDFGQDAVIGLEKDESGDSKYTDLLVVGMGNDDGKVYYGMAASTTDFRQGAPFTVDLKFVWNLGLATFDGQVVLSLCDREGRFREDVCAPIELKGLATHSGMGWDGIPCVIRSRMEAGDRIRMRYKGAYSADWQWASGLGGESVAELIVREEEPGVERSLRLSFDAATRELALAATPGASYELKAVDGTVSAAGEVPAGGAVRIAARGLKGTYTLQLRKGTDGKQLSLVF